jgi:hypothetical protein
MASSGGGSDDYGMDFCRGMSMTMSMGGFQSALFSKRPADCITFLFVDWKLDRPGKFVLAMGEFFVCWVGEGRATICPCRQLRISLPSSSFLLLLLVVQFAHFSWR